MSAIRKPIRIEVIDEDEIGAGARQKKKAPASKAKVEKEPVLPSKKAPATPSPVAVKKKLVTDAIDNEDRIAGSFEEKLRQELEKSQGSSFRQKVGRIAVEEEEEEDDDELDEADQAEEKYIAPKKGPMRMPLSRRFHGEAIDPEVAELASEKDRGNRSVGIYRRIAYFFLFLVLLMGAAVGYFLLVKVTLVLVPDQVKISSSLIFDVEDGEIDNSGANSAVKGIVRTIQIEEEKKYPATGSEVIGKEAIGKVKIINNYNKNQMLVATTRLLAASGEMFRLKETVNAPAGGEIEAEIYADDPSPEMAIAATKFTIPGLWAGLQDKIYAESKEAVVYQQKTKNHIVEEDIDNATRDMKQVLLAKAKEEVKKNYQEYDEVMYDLNKDTIKSTIDAEVGDEVDEATIKMSADVIVIAFGSESATALAEQKFVSSLEADKRMIAFDKESVIYSLNNYNEKEGKATINATFDGKVSLKNGEETIEKDKIRRLSRAQLETYLKDLPGISGFDIKFYPSFLPEFLQRVPSLPERIEVVVKE